MSIPSRGVALLLTASLAACTSFAQPPPGWDMEHEFTAAAILERAVAAGRPADAPPAAEMRDLMGSLEVVRHDVTPPARSTALLLWTRDGRWSLEQRRTGHPAVKYLNDGGRIVEVRDGRVIRRDVPPWEVPVERFLRHLFLLRFFRDGPGGPAEIEEAVARPEGGHAVRIAKEDPAGRTWVLSLDAATLEPIAVREWIERADGGVGAVDTFFDDYQVDARGNRVPRTMRSWTGGKLVQEIQVRDLSWNRGLREVDFRVP